MKRINTRRYNVFNVKNKDLDKLCKYLEDKDLNKFIILLGKLSKTYGITKISKESGLNRESLYKNFLKGANPKLNTLINIFTCLGLTLTIKNIK
jgi:probable addiction module antidote protein